MGHAVVVEGRNRGGGGGVLGQSCETGECSCGVRILLLCNTVMPILLSGMTSQLESVSRWKESNNSLQETTA